MMNKKENKVRTLKSRLAEDLRDRETRESFEEERLALQIAQRILHLREVLGLSQQTLADRMGTSQQTVSRLESGTYEGYSLKTLEKLAEATGTQLKIDFVPFVAIKEKERRSRIS